MIKWEFCKHDDFLELTCSQFLRIGTYLLQWIQFGKFVVGKRLIFNIKTDLGWELKMYSIILYTTNRQFGITSSSHSMASQKIAAREEFVLLWVLRAVVCLLSDDILSELFNTTRMELTQKLTIRNSQIQ